jgi:hypothetical protein
MLTSTGLFASAMIQIALANNPVEVSINKIQTGRGAPVTQQAGFDVLLFMLTSTGLFASAI